MNMHLARPWLVLLLVSSLPFAARPALAADATKGKLKIEKVEPTNSNWSSSGERASVVTGDWKGTPEPSHFSLGALAGLGVVDSTGGFSLIPTASTKIVDHGFVPDVNDTVSFEVELGPTFAKGATSLFYSAQLRWDFQYDRNWIFYALGGVGGFNRPESLNGGGFEMFPRFGVGIMLDPHLPFLFRFELTHELIALGVNVPLF